MKTPDSHPWKRILQLKNRSREQSYREWNMRVKSINRQIKNPRYEQYWEDRIIRQVEELEETNYFS
jgi:primosomal protein N''